MGAISHHKVVAALPNPLEKDSVYFVRAGTGFDIYVTNSAGTVAASALNADALVKALGTASARNVGTGAGEIALNGALGWGVGNGFSAPPLSDWNAPDLMSGAYYLGAQALNPPPWGAAGPGAAGALLVIKEWAGNTGSSGDHKHFAMNRTGRVFYRTVRNNVPAHDWGEFRSTLNTTVDANGFIKAASPIARVSDSAIEGVGALEKLATGHYRITQTQGLRLGGGWYIETPHDRNGDKYFNVEWYQDTEPLAVDGFLDEEVDGVVIDLHCFERVWNPATGRHENGAPVDIPAGRWIDLRFNELKPADEEDEPLES